MIRLYSTNLDAVEGAHDVYSSFMIVRCSGGRLRLLGQLDQGARDALELADVLPAFANNAANLRRRNYYLYSQPHVVRSGHEAFLSHLLEDQVLSLKLLNYTLIIYSRLFQQFITAKVNKLM